MPLWEPSCSSWASLCLGVRGEKNIYCSSLDAYGRQRHGGLLPAPRHSGGSGSLKAGRKRHRCHRRHGCGVERGRADVHRHRRRCLYLDLPGQGQRAEGVECKRQGALCRNLGLLQRKEDKENTGLWHAPGNCSGRIGRLGNGLGKARDDGLEGFAAAGNSLRAGRFPRSGKNRAGMGQSQGQTLRPSQLRRQLPDRRTGAESWRGFQTKKPRRKFEENSE